MHTLSGSKDFGARAMMKTRILTCSGGRSEQDQCRDTRHDL